MSHTASRRPGIDLLFLVLTTAVTVELVRSVGPLLDRAFTNGVVTVAVTALVTFALPGLFVALFVARLRVSGRVVLVAVGTLAVFRLVLQGLTQAIAGGTDLGDLRYAAGLAAVAVALATLVLVAAFVGGARSAGEGAAARWTPGTRVTLGVGLGVLLATGIGLTLGTWDAYWRAGVWGWGPTVLVTGALCACSWLLRHRPGGETAPSGLWLLGPFLALSVQVVANPSFVAAQAGVSLSFAAAGIAVAVLLVAVGVPWAAGWWRHPVGRFAPTVLTVVTALLLAWALMWPEPVAEPARAGWLVFTALLLTVPLLALLLCAGLDRDPRPAGWLRLSGAATLVGLGLILPLLVFQVDYDVPLPFPNAWIPVAVAIVLGVPGSWAGLRAATRGTGVAAAPVEEHAIRTRAARRAAVASALPVRSLAVVTAVVVAFSLLGVRQTSTPTGAVSATPGDAPGTLRVLDWNLHYGVSADPGVDLDEMAAVIEGSGADVVLLQEVSRGWVLGGGADMGTFLARATGMRILFVPAADRQFGNAILWDPGLGDLTDVRRTELPYGDGPQRRSALSATVDADGVPVRFTSVHLQHRVENTPTRLEQLAALFEVEPVTGAYVLGGDLNAGPGSPELDLIEAQGLVSAQDEVGDPTARTFPALHPVERIDWVFGSDAIAFASAEVLDPVASDHRPVLVELTATP